MYTINERFMKLVKEPLNYIWMPEMDKHKQLEEQSAYNRALKLLKGEPWSIVL